MALTKARAPSVSEGLRTALIVTILHNEEDSLATDMDQLVVSA